MKTEKNFIKINNVYLENNKILYDYEIGGEEKFKKIFWMGELFSVEYNANIKEIPESILVIPFLCNILPIAWTNNAYVYINEIDYDFYKCIRKIKKQYKKMLPMLKLKAHIHVNKIVKNKIKENDKCAITFSGGVDSYATLIKHINQKPDLVTIWGADIDWENEEGWNEVKHFVEKVGKKFDLNNILIKASVRRFIDNSELGRQYDSIINDNWWHAMQHGIGLIGNLIPYMYNNNVGKVYIPSTFKKNTKIICASNAEIVNCLKCAGIKTVYDESIDTRQEKVNTICNYKKDKNTNINLRVCYKSKKGVNCCKCEKCYRTIMAITANKMDPKEFGFDMNKNTYDEIKEILKQNNLSVAENSLWQEIKEEFLKEKNYWKDNNDINWILDKNFIQE